MTGFGNDDARRRVGRTDRVSYRLALAAVAAIAVVGASTSAARADTIVVIDGRGFGHGVGMAQDGAYWMAKSGRSAAEILTLFYPGTSLLKQGGTVRVPLMSVGSLTIGFPNGGTIGDRKVPASGQVTVRSTSGGLVAIVSGTSGSGTAQSAAAPSMTRSFALRDSDHTVQVGIELIATRSLILAQSSGSAAEATTSTPFSAAEPTLVPGPSPIVVPVPPDPENQSSVIILSPPTTLAPAPPPTGALPEVSGPIASTGSPPIATAAPTPLDGAGKSTIVTTDTSEPGNSATGHTTLEPVVPVPRLQASAAKSGVVTVGAKRYRGTLELTASSGIRVVNELDMEDYLRGMGEILSPDWPAATLQAQAIAARTYAFRTMATKGEVCPTQRCQVYLGAQAEYPQMDAAVLATRGKVLSYKGKLAATFYSASGGGTIASPTEAFGGSGNDLPYLKAGVYPTGDVKAWTVRMSLGEAGRRLGYAGELHSILVSAVGPSGRATEVTLDGSTGAVHLGGPRVDAALGLRSTFFTVRTETGTLGPSTLATTGAGSDAGTVDLSAQSDLLTSADPAVGGTDVALEADSANARSGTTDADTTSPVTDPTDAIGATVAANVPPPTRSGPSGLDGAGALLARRASTAGAAHRDGGVDLMFGAAVAAAVLVSIAMVRRRRRPRVLTR